MKKLITLLSIISITFTSCNTDTEKDIFQNSEVTEIKSEIVHTTELQSEIEHTADWSSILTALPPLALIDNRLYEVEERSSSKYNNYDLLEAEYIGVTAKQFSTMAPNLNLATNFVPEGMEIYKFDDETYAIARHSPFEELNYLAIHTILKLSGKNQDKLVKYNDLTYIFKVFVEEYNIDNADYIGEITEQLTIEKYPSENMTSNFCEKGSKVYSENTYTLIIRYEEDDNEFFAIGISIHDYVKYMESQTQ